jgi:hypothetical protein
MQMILAAAEAFDLFDPALEETFVGYAVEFTAMASPSGH